MCAEIDFCPPISSAGPVDNQFRCEIRSLVFSYSFCDRRNQYGNPNSVRRTRKYIASSEKLSQFLYHIISLYRLKTWTREKNALSQETNASEKGFLSLKPNNSCISLRKKKLSNYSYLRKAFILHILFLKEGTSIFCTAYLNKISLFLVYNTYFQIVRFKEKSFSYIFSYICVKCFISR